MFVIVMQPTEETLTIDIPDISVSEVNRLEMDVIHGLNQEIFTEHRIINRLDHPVLITLVAKYKGIPIGFKVGYGRNRRIFYSAKGGVLPRFRRNGVARLLLDKMRLLAHSRGFRIFQYDTFPNLFPGMLILGLKEGFKVRNVEWSNQYNDYKMTLEQDLKDFLTQTTR